MLVLPRRKLIFAPACLVSVVFFDDNVFSLMKKLMKFASGKHDAKQMGLRCVVSAKEFKLKHPTWLQSSAYKSSVGHCKGITTSVSFSSEERGLFYVLPDHFKQRSHESPIDNVPNGFRKEDWLVFLGDLTPRWRWHEKHQPKTHLCISHWTSKSTTTNIKIFVDKMRVFLLA